MTSLKKSLKRLNLVLMLLYASQGFSQMSGNPVEGKGNGEWTVSVCGNYFHQQLATEMAVSKRVLAKSIWGLSPYFDLYGVAGVSQLNMRTDDSGIDDFKGQYEFGYGGGIKLQMQRISSLSSIGIWMDIQLLRFKSDGAFMEYLDQAGSSYYRKFQMKYDWRELKGNLGITLPYRSFRVYIAGTGWLLQRLDNKEEYISYGSSESFVGKDNGKYQTGLLKGVTIGVELFLPDQHALSVEALFFSSKDYQIMVGICQTGISDWD